MRTSPPTRSSASPRTPRADQPFRVLVIDEYLAVDVVLGDWPSELPDDDLLLLPASRHFRLLQRIHNPGTGQLSTALARLTPGGREAMRFPHPDVLQVIDPRPLLDDAASIGARYRTGGLLMVETLAAGLAYVTEDRKSLGLILEETIRCNTTMAHLEAVASWGVISGVQETAVAEQYRQAMRIRTPSVFQKVANLSGGNQQKVVLSKWLFTAPEVLILDEPTRGIDVGAKYEIYGIINDLSKAGKGVVMISSELPELLGMCDRIYVMSEGAFVGEVSADEASQELIMSLIVRK